MSHLTIRPARADEVAGLPTMQVRAGAVFRDLGMALVADGSAPAEEEFEGARRTDDLLVAVVDGVVGGFVRTLPLDGALHVEQVTVALDRQRQGIGRALMVAAEDAAARRGFVRLTLTTFRDVPFNGPFYRGLGWTVLDPATLTAGLRAQRRAEQAAGLDRWPRVAMVKLLPRV